MTIWSKACSAHCPSQISDAKVKKQRHKAKITQTLTRNIEVKIAHRNKKKIHYYITVASPNLIVESCNWMSFGFYCYNQMCITSLFWIILSKIHFLPISEIPFLLVIFKMKCNDEFHFFFLLSLWSVLNDLKTQFFLTV